MVKQDKKKPALALKPAGNSNKPKKPVLKIHKAKGNGSAFDTLTAELAALGLRVKIITGDGNCLFRSLADQTQGDEAAHLQLRQQVLQYIHDHRENFEPFIECDEAFDTYVARMRKVGQWAGNLEIQAASMLLESNIAVYQSGQPRWTIKNFPETAKLLHISYHDGEHYNSIRHIDDWHVGPPLPILVPDGIQGQLPQLPWGAKEEERVAASTACSDLALVRRALKVANGEVDGAIEHVIQTLADAAAAEDDAAAADTLLQDAAAASEPAAASEGAIPPVTPEPSEGSAPLRSGAKKRTNVIAAAVSRLLQGPPRPPASAPSSSEETAKEFHARGIDEARQSSLAALTPPESPSIKPTLRSRPAPSPVPRRLSRDGSTIASLAASSATTSSRADGVTDGETGSLADTAGGTSETTTSAAAANDNEAEALGAGGGWGGGRGGEKPPARNKTCPCGSKKKYKSCCGVAAAGKARKQAAAAELAAGADESAVRMATLYI